MEKKKKYIKPDTKIIAMDPRENIAGLVTGSGGASDALSKGQGFSFEEENDEEEPGFSNKSIWDD